MGFGTRSGNGERRVNLPQLFAVIPVRALRAPRNDGELRRLTPRLPFRGVVSASMSFNSGPGMVGC